MGRQSESGHRVKFSGSRCRSHRPSASEIPHPSAGRAGPWRPPWPLPSRTSPRRSGVAGLSFPARISCRSLRPSGGKLGKPGSKSPFPSRRENSSCPPLKSSRPPRKSSLPPRKSSRPPRKSSRPPRKSSRPPRKSSRPPRKSSRPPRKSSRPPLKSSRPPLKSSRPPRKSSRSPPPASLSHHSRPPPPPRLGGARRAAPGGGCSARSSSCHLSDSPCGSAPSMSLPRATAPAAPIP